jgi:hypothetical protein
LRQSGAKVYQYFPNQAKEYLVYDFSKKVGDTVSIFNNASQFGSDTSVVIVYDTGTQSIFGSLRNYKTFHNRLIHATDFWTDQITDSLGITFSETEPGYQLYLVGAVVNSVQYGIIASAPNAKGVTPPDFSLSQNFPNPFNPSTTVLFTAPVGERVVITIYSILGFRVRTLYVGQGNGSTQSAVWDGRDDCGVPVSSGSYFCRIISKGFSATKKMLLVQ